MPGKIPRFTVPIGYVVPDFPSLHWPVGSTKPHYEISNLYYTYDIWRFTVIWTLIFFMGFHIIAALWAGLAKRNVRAALVIFAVYVVIGGIEAVVSGSIVGLILTGVYRAGLCSISTWIPMCWAVVQILWMVFTSYSMMNVFM